jgi:hypothetical protein
LFFSFRQRICVQLQFEHVDFITLCHDATVRFRALSTLILQLQYEVETGTLRNALNLIRGIDQLHFQLLCGAIVLLLVFIEFTTHL